MSRYDERMAERLLYHAVRVFLMIVVLKCCGQDGADDGPRIVFPEPNTYDSATKCEWVFDSTWENGDVIYSWYYPLIYTPEIQCLFFFEAGENEVVEVSFNPLFSIEPSTGCKYDYLEIRDGRFGFSPLIGRLCGDRSPGNITSSGRYLWILFVTDEELEYTGFQAQIRFKPAVTAPPTTVLKPEECFFHLSGSYDGNFSIKPGINLMREEDKHAPVDCVWQIDVAEVNKIKIEFATFKMNTKNHCEQNRILVYDKYSSQEWLIREYCSISAPAAMSISNRMFVRFIASNRSAYNQVEMEYTAYTDRPCDLTFPCGPYMCLNKTLVCNGRPNCWNYAFDEEPEMCEAQPKTSLSVNIALAVTMVIILIIMVITIIVTCRHSCLRTREKAKLMATRQNQLNQQVQTLMDDGNNEANEMNNLEDKYKVSRTGSTANGTRTRSPSGSHDYPMTAAQLKEYEWIMDSELGYEPRQQRTSLMVPDSPWVRANQYNESFRRSSNNPIYPRTPNEDVQVHF